MLTDRLRAWPAKLPYNQLCDAAASLSYSYMPPRMRMSDLDESGQPVLRVLLSGSLLVQRRFEKAWLPIGFLRAGDTLGLPTIMLESSADDIRYTTLYESAEFAILRRTSFDRFLRNTYEKAIAANVAILQRTNPFSSLPEATLRQLVSCSRLVTLPPGELLTREGDATDELFVLKSGVVRLVKSLKTTQTFRWPTEKTPDDDDSFSFSTHGDSFYGAQGPVEFKRAPALSAAGREILDSALKMSAESGRPNGAPLGFTPLRRRSSAGGSGRRDSTGGGGGRRGSTGQRRASLRRSSMSRGEDGEREIPPPPGPGAMGPSSMRRSSERKGVLSVAFAIEQPELDFSVAHGARDGDGDARPGSPSASSGHRYREVAGIDRDRIVVVGEVREGRAFAYDEALSVIRRVALARTTMKTANAFKELPPIRRSATSFCMTEVAAIAMSPIVLLLFIGHDMLAPFIKSFGPARSAQALDKQVRQQREWTRFKRSLLAAAADKAPSVLQSLMGPRRLSARASTLGDNAGAAADIEPTPPTSARLTARSGGRAGKNGTDLGKKRFFEGLQSVVHGAASAELAAASSDMGTTITEHTTIRNHLEPASPRAAAAAHSARARLHANAGRAGDHDRPADAPAPLISGADLLALKVREVGRLGSVLSVIADGRTGRRRSVESR